MLSFLGKGLRLAEHHPSSLDPQMTQTTTGLSTSITSSIPIQTFKSESLSRIFSPLRLKLCTGICKVATSKSKERKFQRIWPIYLDSKKIILGSKRRLSLERRCGSLRWRIWQLRFRKPVKNSVPRSLSVNHYLSTCMGDRQTLSKEERGVKLD
jgi:hypothetical protein